MQVRLTPSVFIARSYMGDIEPTTYAPYQSTSTVLRVDGFLQNGLGGSIATVQGLTDVHASKSWWDAWVRELLRHDVDEIVWSRRNDNQVRYFRKGISDRAKLITGTHGSNHDTYVYIPLQKS